MEFDLPIINFKDIDVSIFTIFFGLYLVAIGIAYYFIFRKHHKKNKVQLDELFSLITRFYTLTILSNITIILGIGCILSANTVKYDRGQVMFCILAGILLISITIINYVFYIKRSLEDMDDTERIATRKKNIKVGEIIELIFFIIFILMPIWRIPKFIEVIDDKKELIIELARSFGLCIAALILINALNPIDIKGRLKKLFTNKNKKIK